MEARRKQLMAKQVQWGDSPSPPHLAPASWDDPPPSTESQPGGDACDERDAALDASIMAEAKARKKRVERNPSTMSSCKDWTLDSLLAQSPNFVAVPHIHWSPSVRTGLEIQIQKHPHGVPLVVSGLHNHPDWPGNKFTPEWLERHHGRDTISARNVCDRTDRELTLSEFIAHARAIPPFAKPDEKERLYGKDVKCPQQWDDFLTRGVIPRYLAPKSPENLLNNLPEDKVRPETLMCYLGVGDTFTPCHKDLCASFGHNLMTYTEDGGSSFWFMTATSSAYAAAEYFHTTLKQELDHETHVITLAQLAKAPFQVYILEQKLGDLVLVPPRSAHQVVNSGGMTIKTSWSRMTLGSLSLALKYELPLYRRVCRSETYKVKATVYHTLLQMIQQLSGSSSNPQNAVASTSRNDNLKPTRDDLGRLIALFDLILIEEYSPDASHMRRLVDESPDDIDTLTCDFCGADVFQSYFECSRCVDDPKPAKYGAGLIICSGCYVEGRTCHCEVMKQMQCRSFDELLKTRQNGVKLYAAGSQRERRPVLPSTVQILAEDQLGLFRAALVLRRRRIQGSERSQSEDERKCSVKRDSSLSHRLPSALVTVCKQCHRTTCFAHLAYDFRFHSAETLLAQAKDQTDNVLHKAHQAAKQRFVTEVAAMRREEPDYTPDPRIQLCDLASTFSSCRPVNPKQDLRSAGFYDLSVWEVEIPPKPKQVPRKPKRFFMEYVLVPAKRRKISSDADDELRLPKKSKIAHTPRPAVGLRSLVPTHTGPSRRKHIVLSDNSDSEVEEPLAKKIRSNPRSSKHSGPQTAISVADAVNNAYKQNSKIVIPKTVPRNPSPPPRPLPRRTTKRKADSGTSPILASSSSEANSPPSTGVSSPHVEQARDTRNLSRPIPGPSPPTEVSRNSSTTAPSGLEAQLAQIHAAIASVAATQRRQDAEVRELRQRYERGVEYNMDSVERQSHSTEGTVRIVADLVQGLVSALPFGGGAQGSFTGQPRHGSGSYRGRGRGRGGGAGHHHSTQRFRPREYPPFLGSVQADPPGAYYEQRAWIPGPHAQDHRDERGVRYGERYGEERQEIREGRRERRPTRFSPPISPENGPDLVLPPSRHSRPSRFDGTESDEGEPVANPERPSGSTAASRRQAPVTNNNNPRSEGSSAPRGRPSTRRSPSPQDEQDWETQYAKET